MVALRHRRKSVRTASVHPTDFDGLTMRRTLTVGFVAVALCVGAADAQAQSDPNDAEYARASQLRSAQQLDEALAIYQRLAAQTHAPRAIGQIGVTEAQMGRWVAAEEHLTAALATHDPWVDAHRAVLQAALDRTAENLGNLTIACNVSGAALRINGTAAGTLPRATPLRVPIGPVVIDVTAEGHEPHRQSVSITTRSTRLEVTLVPAAATLTRPAGAGAAASRVAAPTPSLATVVAPTPASRAASGGSLGRTLAWTSAVGAAVFIGVGVVGYVVGSDAAAQWNDDSRCLQSTMPTVTRGGQCSGLSDTADTMQTLSYAGFIGGAALTITSAVLFVTAPGSQQRERARARFGCGPGPTALGMACGGAF